MQAKDIEARISLLLERFSAVTGTLHRAAPTDATLHLVTAVGIPEPVRPHIETIPYGKGMAGLCAERNEVVQVCNLQTDSSGQAKPRAKETGVEGAIVIPIRNGEGQCIGTLGIGMSHPHAYSQEEIGHLTREAEALAHLL